MKEYKIIRIIFFLLPFSLIQNIYTQSSLYLSPTGDVGIGIDTPLTKLDVNGNLNLRGKFLINGIEGDSGVVMTYNGIGGLQWDTSFKKGIWDLVNSNAKFGVGDVIIEKSLINNAYYNNEGGVIFNKWMPNLEGPNYQPPFFFTGGRFPNIGYGDNFVYNFGSNIGFGGGAYEKDIPGYGLGFENRFYINGKPFNEFHVLAIDQYGIQRRPWYSLFSHDGTEVEMINQLSGLSLHDKDNTKQLYRIDTNGEIMSYNGVGFRHIFNTYNYSPIWQKNHFGVVCPLIGYKDNNLVLADDSIQCTVKLGSTLYLGYGTDSTDIIKPVTTGKSLQFGTLFNGYKNYNFKANTNNILEISNNLSSNSIQFNMESDGNFKLKESTFGNVAIEIMDSLMGKALTVFPSGNVAIGYNINGNHKLNVDGNVLITGNLIFTSDSIKPGQVLTFDSSGLPSSWANNIAKRYEEFFIAQSGQTSFVLNTNIDPITNNIVPIEVYLNGIKMRYTTGTLSLRKFNFQNNTVTLPALNQGDEVEIVYFK